MLIKTVSDNKNRTLSEVRTVLTKNGGKMVEGGSISWQFDQVGKLMLAENEKSEEGLEEILIESGADDYKKENGKTIVYTSVQELQSTQKNLEEAGLKIEEAGLTYVPQNTLELSEEELEKYSEFFDKVEEQDDVVEIYDNVN